MVAEDRAMKGSRAGPLAQHLPHQHLEIAGDLVVRDVGERLTVEVEVEVIHLAEAEQAALPCRRRLEQVRLLFHRFC
jgi:hypothetical protein